MEDDKSHMKTLLKPAEVAALLGVSLRTVYLWCELGLIEGININGKSLRIFSQSLSKKLEKQPHKRGESGSESPSGRLYPATSDDK
jgi:excisionase family DNA binding protein